MVDTIKSLRNSRIGDGFRKTILSIAKSKDCDRLAIVLNKMYLKRLVLGLNQVKSRSDELRIAWLQAKERRNKEGLVMLELFIRNRINQGKESWYFLIG